MTKLALPVLFSLLAALSGCAHEKLQPALVRDATPFDRNVVGAIAPTTFIAGSFTGSNGIVLPYRVLPPIDIVQGVRHPLVLQLHGSGKIGSDNLQQVDPFAKTWAMPEMRARYRAYVLVPQFPNRSANYGPPSKDQYAEHTSALTAALELVEKFSSENAVDKSKIYAVGFSMGGSAAWLAATLRPNVFAAIVPISGIAPDNNAAGLLKDMPIWVMHGNADAENPILPDLRMANRIKTIGGNRILFREYEGLDHQLHHEIYPGYWWRDWLFQQSRSLIELGAQRIDPAAN